jgi:hypothetical protein
VPFLTVSPLFDHLIIFGGGGGGADERYKL